MARRRKNSRWTVNFTLHDAWWALGAAVVVGLFFWSTWQTQRLDALQAERVRLEREYEFAQMRHRAIESQWFAQVSPDLVLHRAAVELGMVTEDASRRSLVAMPRDDRASTTTGWLTQFARRFDRFGELGDAYAAEERP